MWKVVVDPICWKVRNDILHRQQNEFDDVEEEVTAEKILWFVQHRDELLSYHDQFLADFDIAELHWIPRKQKRAWLKHLEIARQAHERETGLKQSHQNSIMRYLVPLVRTNHDESGEPTAPAPVKEETTPPPAQQEKHAAPPANSLLRYFAPLGRTLPDKSEEPTAPPTVKEGPTAPPAR